jgi:hypothetical protein
VDDVGLLGGTESAQPRNRHRAKADDPSKNWAVITLFSTLSSLQPERMTQRSLVSAIPCFSDTPNREAIGGRVLVTVGVWLGEGMPITGKVEVK